MHVPFLENYFNFPSYAAALYIDFLGIFFLRFYHLAYRSIRLWARILAFCFLDFIFQFLRLPVCCRIYGWGNFLCHCFSFFFAATNRPCGSVIGSADCTDHQSL